MITIDHYTLAENFKSASEIYDVLLENSSGFIFMTKVFRARHYSDQAQDCLEAAYVGQQLSKFTEPLSLEKSVEYMHDTEIRFGLKPAKIQELSDYIFELGQIATGEDESLCEDFMNELLDYREKLETVDHAYPELVDDYYASFINGEYYQYDPADNQDFFSEEFTRFPERNYGFCKSAYSKRLKQDFYTSINSIIIPNHHNLEQILTEYSGLKNISMQKADYFALGNIAYLASDGFIVHFPFDKFIQAKSCAWNALEPANDMYADMGQWANGLLTFDRYIAEYNPHENLRGYPVDLSDKIIEEGQDNTQILKVPPVISFYLSSYGDQIMVKDSKYSYFFFSADKLTINELGMLGNRLSALFNTTANLAGFKINIECPWQILNDELFEDLCFDIIYYNPKFDNTKIRKMGKTRSRDGGRDIEVFTHSRPGVPAVKFIFQCKFHKKGSSLAASKVQDISDTVTQFSAGGYGVMTNVVIDATLYDKLDGIARSMNIETEDYSIYKLERILASYPHIKSRYFN